MIGQTLGPYRIESALGAGGMGTVYLAYDRTLRRNVAIKVLSGEVASDEARIRRFEQEARAASALNHPNVCVVHALGETPAGEPFIAMEFIQGQTLRHLLHTQPPTLKTALDIAIQIASAAGAAHAAGIVHRDLKPENVIVRKDGLVKVLDFGLAKMASAGIRADEATRTLVKTDDGVVMGTFTYMAPEQARGQEVDARADIWALGVMLYELVSGRVPFIGATPSDVMVAILDREPAPLDKLNPAVPHELQRIVGKALRKDRTQRYQTIADLRLDLEALKSELQASSVDALPTAASIHAAAVTPQPARRESSAEYIFTGIARHKVAAASTALALVLAAAWALWSAKQNAASGTPASTSKSQRTLTRLTFGEGLQTDPTFSPDGRLIAYASDRSGNFDIWVQPVAGGDPVQVTKDPEPDTQPAWSPDGTTIVYHSEKGGGGLFLVPQLGGPSRRLTTFGEHPAWSRDGSEVLFTDRSGLVGEAKQRLYAVPAAGGTPQELAASVLQHGSWQWIGQHPDGRISAMGTDDTYGLGFYTFTRSGEHLVKSKTSAVPSLVSGTGFDRGRFVWNRSGTQLFIEAKVNVDNIWRVDVDPATLEWRSAERLTTGGGSDIDAVLSDDGRRLAYAQQTTSRRLWSFPFDAAMGHVTGEGRPFSDSSLEAFLGDLAPDGSAAVYMLLRPGAEGGDVWLHRFESGASQLIAPGGFWPKWTPDGRSVLYVKNGTKGAALMQWNPDGTERQVSPFTDERTLLAGNGLPGTRSMFVTVYGDSSKNPLWLWNLDTSSAVPERVLLDRPRSSIWEPHISPNGRWLAFILETPGPERSDKVHVARFADGPINEWTDAVPGTLNSNKPRWAPDGRTLYFITHRGGFLNLAGIRFDPDKGVAVGQPFDVTSFTSPSLRVMPRMDRTEIGVAAHRIMLTMESSTGSIWMLDNVDR